MVDFTIKGWCPGALRPMESGDGLVVRIRPHLARFSADQLRGIAQAALRHGNGIVELTARANLQLRGIRAESHAALIAELDALGLIDPDADSESHRNVVLTPFWQGQETRALALDLYKTLRQGPDLPGKFGFALDLGPRRFLAGTSADIRLESAADQGMILRAEGAPGGQRVTPQEAVAEALRMAEWFLASGGVSGGRGRMAGHDKRAIPFDISVPPAEAAADPLPGMTELGAMIGFEFGILRAEVLRGLAELAPHVRITPWRMLLLEGAALPDHPAMITKASDPRLRLRACTGAPGCPQALRSTRDLALRLAPAVPVGKLLHVSGCAKGCAHPGPADLTLEARTEGFALLQNAAAGGVGPVLDPSEITLETLRKAM